MRISDWSSDVCSSDLAWLARFVDSPNTFANYRKEAERLLLWSTVTVQKPVSSLTHEDLLAYQHFLNDPQPAAQWVMRAGRKVARAHADWRPLDRKSTRLNSSH